jgi:hypothetical protein
MAIASRLPGALLEKLTQALGVSLILPYREVMISGILDWNPSKIPVLFPNPSIARSIVISLRSKV